MFGLYLCESVTTISQNAKYPMRLYEFIDPIACYYHGSTVADLKRLVRQPSKLVNRAVVFAATMPEIAIAMAGHWTDDDFIFGHQTSGKKELRLPAYVMREARAGQFERFFKQPMYLYLVPAKHFKIDDRLQDFEVLSHIDVTVHAMIEVADPLAYLDGSPLIHLVRAR
jgi:hypothetical protein